MGPTPDELRRDIEGTRDHLGDTLGAIEDRMSPRAMVQRRRSAMAERWASVKDAVMGRADDFTSSASGSAHGMASSASDMASGASKLFGAPPDGGRARGGNPWAAGLIAFGGGLLAATLLPVTRTEQQQAQAVVDKAQPLVDEAKQIAGEVGSEMTGEARGHLESLKGDASEAASAVRDTAQSATEDTRQAGRGAAEHVRQGSEGAPTT